MLNAFLGGDEFEIAICPLRAGHLLPAVALACQQSSGQEEKGGGNNVGASRGFALKLCG